MVVYKVKLVTYLAAATAIKEGQYRRPIEDFNMVIDKNEDPTAGSTEFKQLTALKSQLEKLKTRINKEIGNYPPPIPACDAQFNYLLEERSKISKALKQVDTLLTKCETDIIEIDTIEELVKMSNQIDDGMAERSSNDNLGPVSISQ